MTSMTSWIKVCQTPMWELGGGKNIRNHIFIINGIINDVLSSKSNTPIDVQILDYERCFDAMWLEETLNDMYEGE